MESLLLAFIVILFLAFAVFLGNKKNKIALNKIDEAKKIHLESQNILKEILVELKKQNKS